MNMTTHSQEPLVQAKGIIKKFGGFTALNNVDLVIHPGERLGLIGPNGSGKSTLVNCISGMLKTDSGNVILQGKDITLMSPHERVHAGIARSFQIPKPFKSMTVLENVKVVIEFSGKLRSDPNDHRSYDEKALAILQSVGLQNKADAISSGLTQVELRKLELARARSANPQ